MAHSMNKNKGFTLQEVVVVVGVVAVLAAIATPDYHARVAKSQASESVAMMEAEKTAVLVNIAKKGSCTPEGKSYTTAGKYGSLVVSGTVKSIAVQNTDKLLNIGCNLTYTFASDGVSKKLQGKKISTSLFNNGVLSRANTTNTDSAYLPKDLTALTEDPLPSPPSGTGSTNPIEVVKETPVIVEPPPLSTLTGKDEGIRPNGVVCPSSFTYEPGEIVIPITSAGSYKTESNYYVKSSINLYDIFVSTQGRAPTSSDKVKFVTPCSVAIVGDSVATPAITVGNFSSSVKVSLLNYGAVLGRGGRGSDAGAIKGISGRIPAENGGTAIYSNTTTLSVSNYGIIAGGGGGAADSLEAIAGGGGAPYGIGGRKHLALSGAMVGSAASLLKGGASGTYVTEGYSLGPGGDIGKDGTEGLLSGPNWRTDSRPGGKAGAYKQGNVTITNIGGQTLGSP